MDVRVSALLVRIYSRRSRDNVDMGRAQMEIEVRPELLSMGENHLNGMLRRNSGGAWGMTVAAHRMRRPGRDGPDGARTWGGLDHSLERVT